MMIIPLLVASGTLLFAGGIHGLLLPLVGSSEGFDSLLLVYGLGSVAGPILAGVLMNLNSAFSLFVLTLVAHMLMIVFTLYRMTRRDGVIDESKANFVAVGAGRILTPQTVAVVSEEAERQEMA